MWSKKFLIQLFFIGVFFLFLLSNIFQPEFWSLKTAGAVSDGLGISLDDNSSYSTSLNAHIINSGSTPAGSQTFQFGVFHCKTANSEYCDGGHSDVASDSPGVGSISLDIPGPGESLRTNVTVPSFSCGRVQVDFGWPGHDENGGIVGGKVFNLGSNCEEPAPVTRTASLSAGCPNNTPTLTANWNVGSGSSCNIYIRAGSTDNQISANCEGSDIRTSLPSSGAVVDGGSYKLFASDGTTTTESDGVATVTGCSAPPPPPPPPAPTCTYGSTQARWQVNTSDPWGSAKSVSAGQSANVGSFHNATGEFAGDTTLTVTGPGANQTLANGGSFTPNQAGTYTLTVNTNGQSGGGCTDTATLTATGTTPPACPFNSTQARVQKNIQDPWASSKTINLGDQIRVGGFHNGTGLFADPGTIALNVTGPESFSNQSNGAFITPTKAGVFNLTATTPSGSGSACTDTATFTVNGNPACVPNGSCSAPTPACGTATTGVDNCGNPCSKQGSACTPPGGGPITVSPVITNTNTNTNNQTVNVTQTPGNVGVATQPVTQLPKTGLPALAWSALAFLPAGFSMKKFKKLKRALEDDPSFIWEDRQFKGRV